MLHTHREVGGDKTYADDFRPFERGPCIEVLKCSRVSVPVTAFAFEVRRRPRTDMPLSVDVDYQELHITIAWTRRQWSLWV